ncbi:hypothetical protein A2863_01845 [Candidatus Woesebacteria bacterium RIFCSPHIGHO2_01_FULL_38_9b]|uniref:Phage holin family protein n=1 Tax=Candidatus Woesebacteria bacterium RIFCSPHIGHO2_01_FULL_38_9b TaxID=1802493 RepID=A0A1F7XYE5_9BACT|nr:MAG: hypothetical protein A2863_01845 [Candidatus Woesebacteria bacterium RIFCSPHIGHO2_01_FULL_38_9b]
MKRIIRHFVIDTYSLWLVTSIASGIVFGNGIKTLIFTGFFISITSLVAKPVINILLLPLNLVTFGLFRWVSSAVVLYLVTLIVKDFKIISFTFAGFSSKWIDIPHINLDGIWTYIGFSFLLSIITSFIYWLIKN